MPHDVTPVGDGGDGGGSSECDRLARDLQNLNASVAIFQSKLNSTSGPDGPGTERDGIRNTVAFITDQIKVVEAQIRNSCVGGPIPSRPLSPLQIVGIEATQAIQFFRLTGQGSLFAADNTVPLVSRKPLILRIYINQRNLPGIPVVSQVTGTVTIGDNGPDLSPINGPIQAPSSTLFIDRSNANRTLNFLVPASYCTDTVVFKVKAFDPGHPSDATYSSLTSAIILTFRKVKRPSVHGVVFRVNGPVFISLDPPTGFDLVRTLDRFVRLFPFSGFDYSLCELNSIDNLSKEKKDWDRLLTKVKNMRSTSGSSEIYVGLLPKDTPITLKSSIRGISAQGGGVAIASADDTRALEHETGHALGASHAPGCGAPGTDPNYPTYGFFPSGSIGEFGFDYATSTIFNPNQVEDMMTYCDQPPPPWPLFPANTWISPYNYLLIMNGVGAFAGTRNFAGPDRGRMTREYLVLNFRIYRDDRVQLLHSYHIHGPAPDQSLTPELPVYCELLDAQGQVIESHRCHIFSSHQDPEGPHLDFHEALAWYPDAHSIAFVRKGKVIHTHDIEKAPPEVSVNAPKRVKAQGAEKHGDLMQIKWQAKSKNKPVRFLLRYSNDNGATWRTIDADLSETEAVVNLDLFPGGEQCKFQVAASVGVRTAFAETASFTVAKKPRHVHILTPAPDAVFRPGELVRFLGAGFSPDCGTSDFEDVVWTSNRDGVIGIGYELLCHTLSIGRHRISLTLPNGLGGEATAAVFITIGDAVTRPSLSPC